MSRLSINELTTFRWTFEDDICHYTDACVSAIGIWRPKLADYGEEKGAELLKEANFKVTSLSWVGGFTSSDMRSFDDQVADACETIELSEEALAKVQDPLARGTDARFVETNHGEKLLHHNKFLVMDLPGDQPDMVFTGAGNFTGSAFSDNFENFYGITIPAVVDAFKAQYDHLHGDLATAPGDMPTTNVMPEAAP